MLDDLTRNDRERSAQMDQLIADVKSIRDRDVGEVEEYLGVAVDDRFATVKL